MIEQPIVTDAEHRLKQLETQYATRRTEAERTGKPVPDHVERWYHKQFAEARAAVNRATASMLTDEDKRALIIARITAVKQDVEAKEKQKRPAVKAKAEPKPPAESKPKRNSFIGLTEEEKKAKRAALKRERYANDPEYRLKQMEYYDRKNASRRERWATDPDFRNRMNEKRRGYAKRYIERMQTDSEYAAQLLAKRERSMDMKAQFNMLREAHAKALAGVKDRLPTAKDLVGEAVVAEAIENGTLPQEAVALHIQHLRIVTAVMDTKYNLTKAEKEVIRRFERRRAARETDLLDQTVEVGWARKEIRKNPELRKMFEVSVQRSTNSAIWNVERAGTKMTEKQKAMKREEFVQKLLLKLDANHDFLHEQAAHRAASLARTNAKMKAEMDADPAKKEAHRARTRAYYHRKKAEAAATAPPPEPPGPTVKDAVLKILQQARKDAPKT